MPAGTPSPVTRIKRDYSHQGSALNTRSPAPKNDLHKERSNLQADTLSPFCYQIRRVRLRRYVGGEPGGSCQRSEARNSGHRSGKALAAGGCEVVCPGAGGSTRVPLGGDVVPFWAQLKTQQSLASATSGVSSLRSAAAQQSMSIIPCMPQSLWPAGKGTPAKAPPNSTSRRNRDAIRVFIPTALYLKLAITVNPLSIGSC